MLEGSSQIYKKDFYSFSVEKKFISKKNNVFLVKTNEPGEKYLVQKIYSCPEKMPGEVEMLCLLKEKGVAVPQIFGTGENYVLLEYLEGPLFLDFFCWQENICGPDRSSLKGPAYQTIYSLCSWFKSFYTASRAITGRQYIMGDVNFRNFIIREKIYGVDLEECREGKIEEDIGNLCAYALTYSPTFSSWKMAMTGKLLQILISELDLDKELVKKEIQKGLLFIAGIRGTLHEMAKIPVNKLLEKSMRFV